MNNVILIGYLGSAAETRKTRNDSTLTTLSLATQRTWKDRESGERQSQTTWHRLVVFGRLAEPLRPPAHRQNRRSDPCRGHSHQARRSVRYYWP